MRRFVMLLNADEIAAYRAHAKRLGLSISEWLRSLAYAALPASVRKRLPPPKQE